MCLPAADRPLPPLAPRRPVLILLAATGLLGALAAVPMTAAAASSEYRVELPGRRGLVLDLPAGWKAETSTNPLQANGAAAADAASGQSSRQPPVVQISAVAAPVAGSAAAASARPAPPVMRLVLMPSWVQRPGATSPNQGVLLPTAPELRTLTQRAISRLQARVEEPELKLLDLGVSGRSGYYFHSTLREPEAGGFRQLTQGVLAVDELRVSFSIHSQPGASAQVLAQQAMELVRSLRRAPQPVVKQSESLSSPKPVLAPFTPSGKP